MTEISKKDDYAAILAQYFDPQPKISLADLLLPPPPKPNPPPIDIRAIIASLERPAAPTIDYAALLRSLATPPSYLGSLEQDRQAEQILKSLSAGPGAAEREKCERAEHAVRRAIAQDSTLASLPITVFRQGSYRAQTNIGVDSDVDLCVCLTSVFFYEYPAGVSHGDVGNVARTMPFGAFRTVVGQALRAQFGGSMTPGSKAFDIRETAKRVEADVLPACAYRWYYSRDAFYSGIGFWNKEGTKFTWNYPEYSFQNGDDKDSFLRTRGRYKQVVRILKALRARMEKAEIQAAKGVASFLIESLVYNVEDAVYQRHVNFLPLLREVLSAMRLMTAPTSALRPREVNGIKFLFSPAQSWTREQAHAFVSACWRYIGYK